MFSIIDISVTRDVTCHGSDDETDDIEREEGPARLPLQVVKQIRVIGGVCGDDDDGDVLVVEAEPRSRGQTRHRHGYNAT